MDLNIGNGHGSQGSVPMEFQALENGRAPGTQDMCVDRVCVHGAVEGEEKK